jgi:hypothetical protein
LAPVLVVADEQFVASTFSKAAIYIYNRDFIYAPVAEWFSVEELASLAQHKAELGSMVRNALGGGDSVGGAALSAHLELEESIPELRSRLFQPGPGYSGDGARYETEEDFLRDGLFVYHFVYLRAIEEIAGGPIDEVVQPTQQETQELFRHLENPENRYYYWAKWLARKFPLLESPE